MYRAIMIDLLLRCRFVILLFGLAGCMQTFETDFLVPVEAAITENWRVEQVRVTVPKTLHVSEEKRFAPDGDIVWRGEPLGDRYAQIGRIFEEAVGQGMSGLSGEREVIANVTVLRFHALSERARKYLQFSGVHDILFTIQVMDLRTGLPMTRETTIQADLEAWTGQKALNAELLGNGQRVRLVRHLEHVIKSWLGQGPDMRRKFVRIGL